MRTLLRLVAGALLLYFLVSVFAYSWAHPDMTEARKFLNTWDALTWDWEDKEKPDAK